MIYLILSKQQFPNHYRFDHFHISLQAISEGLGLGIGPINILSNDIKSGKLQILFPEIHIAPICYYALTPVGVQKTKTHMDFEQCLSTKMAHYSDLIGYIPTIQEQK